MKKLIKIFKNKTLQKSIFILSFVFVFSVSEVKTARAEICENILITWACNVVDDVGDAIRNGISSVFQVVSNISGFLNIEQVTNNILGIVAGTIEGTSSWIAGGNASDGYKQGFCITKNNTSGDFLNGGDCTANGGEIINLSELRASYCPAPYSYSITPNGSDRSKCFKICEENTYSSAGTIGYPSICTPCPADYPMATGTGRISIYDCFKYCEIGTYNNEGFVYYLGDCKLADTGWYVSKVGQTSQLPCPDGIKVTRPSRGATDVTACVIDPDGNGLINIKDVIMFDKIRNYPSGLAYRPGPLPGWGLGLRKGCPGDVCKGYELSADIDLNSTVTHTTAPESVVSPYIIRPTSVSIVPTSMTLYQSTTTISYDIDNTPIIYPNTATVTAIISPYKAANKNVTWSSDDSSVAFVNWVGNDVVVIANAPGTTRITATSVASPNVSNSIQVTVKGLRALYCSYWKTPKQNRLYIAPLELGCPYDWTRNPSPDSGS